MSFISTRRMAGVAAATLAAFVLAAPAAAQTPPIKPGLWEIKTDTANGQKAPDVSERMKNLPPEVRAKVEAMMKDKGVAVGSGGAIRVCLTKEKLNADAWHNNGTCKTDYSQRTSAAWKWHSVCSQPAAVVDGEAIFADSEHYTINMSSTVDVNGQSRTSQRSMNAARVSADCGDLKTFDPKR